MKKVLYFCLSHFPNLGIIRFLVNLKSPQSLVQFCLQCYFVKLLKVNLDEAEKSIASYHSFLDFFTRRLKKGARTINPQPTVITSPVDAKILEYGTIAEGTLIQAKGHYYSIEELVGNDLGKGYRNGQYITLYLSPRDYHRIHHPVSANIEEVRYFPGRLYPVNPFSLNNFNHVFSKNKRVIVSYTNPSLNLLSCWVGALNVGGLKVLFDDTFYPTSTKKYDKETKQKYFSKNYRRKKPVEKGGEAGCFELGSTVILILPPNDRVKLSFKNDFIYLGEEIAKTI